MTLPLYGTVKSCAACGVGEVEERNFGNVQIGPHKFGTEFKRSLWDGTRVLKRTCWNCGYVWYERPLYAGEDDEGEKECCRDTDSIDFECGVAYTKEELLNDMFKHLAIARKFFNMYRRCADD